MPGRRRGTMGLLLIGCLVAACGGDGNGDSGAPASSGLAPGRPIGTLTAAESAQLCKTVEGTFVDPAVTDSLCRFAAGLAAGAITIFMPDLTDAQLQAACTEAFAECKKPDAAQSGKNECKPPQASCTATVGELEKCLADTKASLLKLGAAFPACSMLTKASLSTPAAAGGEALTKTPESCKAIEQKCPGLVPDTDLPN